MTVDPKERMDALNEMILAGKIVEAMHEFYAEDVVMGENDDPPTVGLAANIAREEEFVEKTTWYGLELKSTAVGGDVTMVQWFMDFHNKDYGDRLSFTQVAVQRWRDGKIYDERFYYSPQVISEPA